MNVCMVTPAPIAASETFLRAHQERLPANVIPAWGVDMPFVAGRPALDYSIPRRIARRAMTVLLRRGSCWNMTAGYASIFRRARASVVLAEYGFMGVHVLEAVRRTGTPLVVHFHGIDAYARGVLDEFREGYRAMFQEAAAVIAVSQAMRTQLLALGAPEAKLHLNWYGVDCSYFTPADPGAQGPVFLGVGRFVEKKAPYLTLLAFSHVHRAFPEARLRMVGEGPLLGLCRNLAAALRIEDAVAFLGAQSHAVVREEMRKARCFVQHSLVAPDGDSEGTPVAILEALACGLPVVATRHAGICDSIVHEKTGFLVDERDVEGMAAAMLRIAQESELARAWGAAGRERIEQCFSMEQSIHGLWRILESSKRRGG